MHEFIMNIPFSFLKIYFQITILTFKDCILFEARRQGFASIGMGLHRGKSHFIFHINRYYIDNLFRFYFDNVTPYVTQNTFNN